MSIFLEIRNSVLMFVSMSQAYFMMSWVCSKRDYEIMSLILPGLTWKDSSIQLVFLIGETLIECDSSFY